YDAFYKWAGVLAGAKGTVLFWAWLIALSLTIEGLMQHRRSKALPEDYEGSETQIFDWIRLVVAVVSTALIYLLIVTDLFKVTPQSILSAYPDGYGLHENLLTPLMIAHPPVEFMGYAFTTIPMAGALAFFITRNDKWSSVTAQWGRLAWLFYALGIGVGGLWAYIVLGWGGYWAWDPIETVNLIPFFTLTAFVHAQLRHRQRKWFRYIGPLLAVVTFVLSLFATFVTRSGLWVSVHDFAEVDIKEPGSRLLRIIELDEGPRFFFAMMVITLLVTAVLVTWYLTKRFAKRNPLKRPLPYIPSLYIALLLILIAYVLFDVVSFTSTAISLSAFLGNGNGLLGAGILLAILAGIPITWGLMKSEDSDEEGKSKSGLRAFISDHPLMIAALTILSIATIVLTILLIQGVNGIQREVFDVRIPWIIFPLMIVISVCMMWTYLGRENALYLLGLLIGLGIVGYLVYPANWFVGVGVPIFAASLTFAAYKIFRVAGGRPRKLKRLDVAGALLIASSLLGLFLWGYPPSTLDVLGWTFHPDFLVAFLGFLGAAFVLVAAIVTFARRSFKVSVLGALIGIATFGYLVGIILSAAALILIVASRSTFLPRQLQKRALSSIVRRMRPVGSHLVHFGLAMFLIGYAVSTYMETETSQDGATEAAFLDLQRGEVASFDGYDFRLLSSKGRNLDPDAGYELIESSIEISKEGKVLSVAQPHMKWAPHMGHYHQFVYVENLVVKDIYFIVRGFYTPSDGWMESMGGGGSQGVKFLSDNVTSVALVLKSIPGMSLVWSGFWIMCAGIVHIVVHGYLLPRYGKLGESSRTPRPRRGGLGGQVSNGNGVKAVKGFVGPDWKVQQEQEKRVK
ncbi:MAG: cytochrome c biogenesis protein CcsA, partial [Thermoplasmata archaeon]